MTYLQAVNKVLVRLRESTVATVSETAYSALIGEFVNDAKRAVEDSWNWGALRTTLTVNTSTGVFNYVLTDSQQSITVLDVINDTSNWFMTPKTSSEFNNLFLNATAVPETSPKWYTFNGVDSNGDTAIDVYPIPNGVYDLRFNVVLRTADFENDADVFGVPTMPVIQLATAFGARERGETGGTSSQELFSIADNTLADAVAFDAARFSDETIWYTV
jgi:hypothetical protein|tara:strand:+ start:540 stop:1190 length:651 start_codon:yes stop_codon:yes gene_type:complete